MSMTFLPFEIGDKLTATQETFDFHKGFKYEVSNVFHNPKHRGKFIVLVKNKYGKKMLLSHSSYLEIYPTKIHVKRLFESRLKFFWDFKYSWTLGSGWRHGTEKQFWKLERGAHYCGDEKRKAHAECYIKTYDESTKTWVYKDGSSFIVPFYSYEDYFKYFMKIWEEKAKKDDTWSNYDFKPEGSLGDQQYGIDLTAFYLHKAYPDYPADYPETWEVKTTYSNSYYEMPFKEFLDTLSELIFDTPTFPTQESKDLVKDIITCFKLLPSSHSATSVVKVMQGKSKKKLSAVEDLEGKYKDYYLKQPQMFELASWLEGYLFRQGIFKTKEEYSSGEEWRGAFEFIGSKHIDIDKLDKLVAQI